jgi:hypothetical protein
LFVVSKIGFQCVVRFRGACYNIVDATLWELGDIQEVVGLSSKFLWRPRLVRAVSGGGPKSWFVGKLARCDAALGCSSYSPERFHHSFLVGKIVRRSLTRVSKNVAGLKPIQIILHFYDNLERRISH